MYWRILITITALDKAHIGQENCLKNVVDVNTNTNGRAYFYYQSIGVVLVSVDSGFSRSSPYLTKDELLNKEELLKDFW